MIGLLLMVYAVYHCKRYGEDKEKIHAEVKVLHDKGLLRVLKESFFALLSPVIILGCIYSGVASPTEAAVISVFYALIISLFVYRSIRIRDIWSILVEAIRTFTPILFILAASTAFSRVLTLMQVPQTVSEFILNNFHSPVAILLIINVFLLIVGMVMDTTPAILILTPILLPIVQAIGMNPIQLVSSCCQPCDWFRNTADRRQPVRGKLPDRGSGHADRKEGYADDRFLSRGTAADYVYSGNFDWNFIGRSEGQ